MADVLSPPESSMNQTRVLSSGNSLQVPFTMETDAFEMMPLDTSHGTGQLENLSAWNLDDENRNASNDGGDTIRRECPYTTDRQINSDQRLSSPDIMEDCILRLSQLQISLYRWSRSASPTRNPGSDKDRLAVYKMNPLSTISSDFAPSAQSQIKIDETFRASQTLFDILQQLYPAPADSNANQGSVPSLSVSAVSNRSQLQDRGNSMAFTFSDSSSSESSSDSATFLSEPPLKGPDSSNFDSRLPAGAPDSATTLLALTCWIRLLHVYDGLVENLHYLLTTSGSPFDIALGLPGIQIGSFSTPSYSSLPIVLVLRLMTLLLDDIDKAFRRLASAVEQSHQQRSTSGDRTKDGEGKRRTTSWYVAETAVEEAKGLERGLRKKIKTVKSQVSVYRG